MSNKPLVSVFIPYYNDKKFLEYSIKSVLEQSYENFELILLNHASTDGSYNVAHFFKDSRIKHVDMNINLGAGGGILFQKMLDSSSGKYIKTLCADDVLKPDCLEILVNYMEENPDIDFAFGNANYVDEKGNDLHDSWFDSRPYFSIEDDEVACIKKYVHGISFLPYIGNISKKEIFNDIQINKTYVMMFDMSLWFSLLCRGFKIGFCDEKVVNYRISKYQMSSIKNKNAVSKYSVCEFASFWKILFTIDDIRLVKKVFSGSPYSDCLNSVKDIPFFVAINLVNTHRPHVNVYISEILQEKEKRDYCIKTFNYGVKELRRDCLFVLDGKKKSLFSKFKNKIYTKNVKELNILDLIFLLIHFIVNTVLLGPLRATRMRKREKKYTM